MRYNAIFIYQHDIIDPKIKVLYICIFMWLDKNVKIWDKMQHRYSNCHIFNNLKLEINVLWKYCQG